MHIKSYITALFLFAAGPLFAQSLSTGFDNLEDYYRREQLLGNISADHSFVSYPLFPTRAFGVSDPFTPEEESNQFPDAGFRDVKNSDNEKLIVKALPFVWNNQYNSHHPEDWNDGIMIPARGYQTVVSGGIFLRYSLLSIQLQPEFLYAENKYYEGFPLTRNNPELATLRWAQYYFHTLNHIDLPEMFGEEPIQKISLGQSSIRLTYKAFSIGYSNENLWWGPGIRNSLLMTNTAPGFSHFTLNTVRPVRTPVGSFEGQIVGGILKPSGYLPPNTGIVDYRGVPFYVPKRELDRYFNGMIINYSPKWIKGLHLGLIRSFQMYCADKDGTLNADLPVFTRFREKNLQAKNPEGEEGKLSNHQKRNGYYSYFMRYVWPESHVEIYGEYGFSDNHWDNRDFIVELEYSTAYNLGFRKLIPFNNGTKDVFQAGLEITQLSKNPTSKLRGPQETYTQGINTWYTSTGIEQGYTHQGQMLGAGIGPGSDLMTLDLGWNRGLKALNLLLERYAHNNDFLFEDIKDIRMHWVDLSASLNGNWDYKNFLFNCRFKFVSSKNYQWVFDYNPDDYWDTGGGLDVFNFQGQLGVMYRF